jgi:hypothetical protein
MGLHCVGGMSELIAGRFISSGGWQLDLARGAPVSLRLFAAGTNAHQAVWSDSCATLARLRHPLLNALVDYGAADRYRLFEAYEITPPLKGAGLPASRLIGHVTRFLEAHAVPLGRDAAKRVVREVAHGPGPRGRPVGIVLQPRRALDAITDVLRDAAPGGVASIEVRGTVVRIRTLRIRGARSPAEDAPVRRSAERRSWLAEARSLDMSRFRRGTQPVRAVAVFIASPRCARRHVLIVWRAEPGPERCS